MEYYKLNDILLEMHSGGTPSTEKKEYWNGTIKWLSSGETSQNFIYDTIDKITEEGVKNSSTKLANKNDVVMACAGQGKTRGQVSYLLDDMYINQSVIALKANPKKVNSLYLYYNLSSRYDELRGGSDFSSTRGSITTATLKKLNIQLPPLPTQQKIAGILSKYDEAIENNNKRIKLLEQMAQNLYKEWFVRFRFPGWQNAEFENGIPKGWKVEKLGNLFERLPFGRTYKKEDLEKEGSVIVIDQSTDDYLGFHNDEPAYKANFESPMILFGDHTCKFVLMTRDFSLGENIIPIKPRNCNPYYLFRSIDGIIKTTEYKRHWSILITQKIFIPSENLQNKFGEVYRSFIKQIENLTQQTQNLSRQRDLLLPRLMSGKLQVFRK